MEGRIRVINTKTGNHKFVSPAVANSRAMKAQGFVIEQAAKRSQTFEDMPEDTTAAPVIETPTEVDLLAQRPETATVPEKGKPGPKPKAKK